MQTTVHSGRPALVTEDGGGPDSLQSRALAVRGSHSMVSFADVLADLDRPGAMEEAKRFSGLYDKACAALLSENDEQVADEDRGKPKEKQRKFKKKSAWLKLAKFFRISTEIITREQWWETDPDGTVQLVARVVVRATAPWGQTMEAVALCSTRESKFLTKGPACPECNGPMWDNRDNPRDGAHFACKNRDCRGRLAAGEYTAREVGVLIPSPKARAKANNDVEAIAQTRATNRAVSNLVGAGEVSAEEIEGEGDALGGGGDSNDPAAVPQARQQQASGGRAQQQKADTPECPDCHGPMWDNVEKVGEKQRAGEEKTGPLYKCKNTSCGKAIWPKKNVLYGVAAREAEARGAGQPEKEQPTVEGVTKALRNLAGQYEALQREHQVFEEPGPVARAEEVIAKAQSLDEGQRLATLRQAGGVMKGQFDKLKASPPPPPPDVDALAGMWEDDEEDTGL